MTDGHIERTDEQVIFRYQRHLPHPVEVVWHAITDPAEVAKWMGTSPEIDLQVGGHYITYHGDHRVTDRILTVEPPRLFTHTFFEHVNPGASVTWQLAPADPGTLLELTHVMTKSDLDTAMTTVASGDDIITILARNAAGWHHILDRVAGSLDNIDHASSSDPRELQARYAATLT